jgi:hypothetical protein
MLPQNDRHRNKRAKLPAEMGKNLVEFQVYFEIFPLVGFAIRRNTKMEGGQIPCGKRLSEKMNMLTSARIAADCFRKMQEDAEKEILLR